MKIEFAFAMTRNDFSSLICDISPVDSVYEQ